MAYMSQARKAEMAPRIKEVLKKHGLKGSISVSNHTSLVVTISEGKIDFGTREPVNHYYINDHYEGEAAKALSELRDAMMIGNHNNSDAMTDYFDVGWYIDINIGKWNKPYKMIAPC